MKRLTALLLALALAASLTACAGNGARKLAGTWVCRVDLTSRLNAEMEKALSPGTVTTEAEAAVYLCLTVEKDGAYTLTFDTEATEASRSSYMESLRPALTEALYQQAEAEGSTRADYDKTLSEMGMTADECVSAILDAIDLNTYLTLLCGDSADTVLLSGTCRAKKGQLALSTAVSGDTIAYTLKGDSMTWTDENNVLADYLTEKEQVLLTFPMQWTR